MTNIYVFIQLYSLALLNFLYAILAMATLCTSSGPSANRRHRAAAKNAGSGLSLLTPAPPNDCKESKFYSLCLLNFLNSIFAMALLCTSSGPSASRRTLAHMKKLASGTSLFTPPPPNDWKQKLWLKHFCTINLARDKLLVTNTWTFNIQYNR